MRKRQSLLRLKVKQPKPPKALVDLQAWFGAQISTPLTPSLETINWEKEKPEAVALAQARLRSVHQLEGQARVEIYNRQYWYRLISVMQVDYTCTLHVMGLRKYNAWVMRYLQDYPPDSPYLNALDSRFEAFLTEHYHDIHRDLVLEATAYDRAFALAFEAGPGCKLELQSLSGHDLLSVPLQLMPHVTALRLDHDWPSYRALCTADSSLEGVFEIPTSKKWNCVIYRHHTTLYEKEMPATACLILQTMRAPGTLTEIFDRLPELPEADQKELEENLSNWFNDFVERGWVGSPSGPAYIGA